jgi:sulfofructose kinase
MAGDIGTSDPVVLKHLSSQCDYAVYSDIGWKILTGLDAPDHGVMRELAVEFGNVVSVTGGSSGSWWCIEGELHHVPAIAVPVVDTTGAGDVFHGAFAAGLARRQPILQAAVYASAAAAEKIRRGDGWDGMPSDADVAALMRETIAG